MTKDEMTSFRLPADLLKGLRLRAEESGATMSDVLRDAVLMLLGTCPTCGQRAPAQEPAGEEAGDGG